MGGGMQLIHFSFGYPQSSGVAEKSTPILKQFVAKLWIVLPICSFYPLHNNPINREGLFDGGWCKVTQKTLLLPRIWTLIFQVLIKQPKTHNKESYIILCKASLQSSS